MSNQLNRRDMLRRTALAGAGFWTIFGSQAAAQSKSPNEKLNIAGIGVGGRGTKMSLEWPARISSPFAMSTSNGPATRSSGSLRPGGSKTFA